MQFVEVEQDFFWLGKGGKSRQHRPSSSFVVQDDISTISGITTEDDTETAASSQEENGKQRVVREEEYYWTERTALLWTGTPVQVVGARIVQEATDDMERSNAIATIALLSTIGILVVVILVSVGQTLLACLPTRPILPAEVVSNGFQLAAPLDEEHRHHMTVMRQYLRDNHH